MHQTSLIVEITKSNFPAQDGKYLVVRTKGQTTIGATIQRPQDLPGKSLHEVLAEAQIADHDELLREARRELSAILIHNRRFPG